MDDDLMSLRKGASSPREDDDLLGGFGDSAGAGKAGGTTGAGKPSDDLDFSALDQPDWMQELPTAEPAAPPVTIAPKKTMAPARKAKARPRRAGRSSAAFMGMNPQQRMILSVFLFLDVSVLSCLILISIGAFGFR